MDLHWGYQSTDRVRSESQPLCDLPHNSSARYLGQLRLQLDTGHRPQLQLLGRQGHTVMPILAKTYILSARNTKIQCVKSIPTVAAEAGQSNDGTGGPGSKVLATARTAG